MIQKEGQNFEFLEVKLVNDPIKLTNKRSAMEILAFFGAIGGMQRFVGKFFGMVGNYFSSKFFGAKLANDLYIMKKKKKIQNKHTSTPENKVNIKNKLIVPEDFTKESLYERFKISTW